MWNVSSACFRKQEPEGTIWRCPPTWPCPCALLQGAPLLLWGQANKPSGLRLLGHPTRQALPTSFFFTYCGKIAINQKFYWFILTCFEFLIQWPYIHNVVQPSLLSPKPFHYPHSDFVSTKQKLHISPSLNLWQPQSILCLLAIACYRYFH